MPAQLSWRQPILAAVANAPQAFQTLPWPTQPLHILIAAPHPDDFDAIAITLRWLAAQNHQLNLCVLSGGSKGVQDGYQSTYDWHEKAKIREYEQLKSCALFGIDTKQVDFLRLAEADDGELDDSLENQQAIQQAITAQEYDVVMLPYGKDSNTAHQRTYAMVKAAVKNCSHPILSCCNKDAKTLNFQLHSYMTFDAKEAQWKAELLRCHDSQHSRNLNLRGHGFDDRVLQFNQATAASLSSTAPITLNNDDYAEAFHLESWN